MIPCFTCGKPITIQSAFYSDDDIEDALFQLQREEDDARGLIPCQNWTDEEFDEWVKEHFD